MKKIKMKIEGVVTLDEEEGAYILYNNKEILTQKDYDSIPVNETFILGCNGNSGWVSRDVGMFRKK